MIEQYYSVHGMKITKNKNIQKFYELRQIKFKKVKQNDCRRTPDN